MNETKIQRKKKTERERKRERYRTEKERHKSIIRTRLDIVENKTGKLLNEDKVKMQYVQLMSQHSSGLVGLFV